MGSVGVIAGGIGVIGPNGIERRKKRSSTSTVATPGDYYSFLSISARRTRRGPISARLLEWMTMTERCYTSNWRTSIACAKKTPKKVHVIISCLYPAIDLDDVSQPSHF